MSKKAADGDLVDEVVDGFKRERPDLSPRTVETVCRLIVAGRIMQDAAAATLSAYKVNYTDFDVLGMLRWSGPPFEQTPAELMRVVMITSGAMTTCLDRLETKGLAKRRLSDTDRRSRVVSLTAKGRKVVDDALTRRFAEAERLIAGLSAKDVKALNSLLRAVSEAAAAE